MGPSPDRDEEIGVNRSVAGWTAGCAAVAAIIMLLAWFGNENRLVANAGLVFVAVGVVVLALRSRPGVSIVLGAHELRVRGLVRWRAIPYASIDRIGDVWGQSGNQSESGVDGRYFRIRVHHARSVRITALQSAMPIAQLRSKLAERVHRAQAIATRAASGAAQKRGTSA